MPAEQQLLTCCSQGLPAAACDGGRATTHEEAAASQTAHRGECLDGECWQMHNELLLPLPQPQPPVSHILLKAVMSERSEEEEVEEEEEEEEEAI
ncbi:hypothetical protein ABVT39_001826 [Epinephelus coioides]